MPDSHVSVNQAFSDSIRNSAASFTYSVQALQLLIDKRRYRSPICIPKRVAIRLHVHLHETRPCNFAQHSYYGPVYRHHGSISSIRSRPHCIHGRDHAARLGVNVCVRPAHRPAVAEIVSLYASRHADQKSPGQSLCSQVGSLRRVFIELASTLAGSTGVLKIFVLADVVAVAGFQSAEDHGRQDRP